MTLVEKFIEFNGWTTSRKTALLAALGLAMHIAVALTARIALATMKCGQPAQFRLLHASSLA